MRTHGTLDGSATRALRFLLGALLVLVGRGADGQLPGLPVLQGAFAAPGLAVAANIGRGDGRTAVVAAVGYGKGSGRFHVDVGAGVLTGNTPGFRGNQAAYGLRAGATVFRLFADRISVTPFAGFGSTRAKVVDSRAAALPVVVGDSGRTLQSDQIPVGASLGSRFGLPGGRAAALSVAPIYAWYRRSGLTTDETRGRVRIAVVAELAITHRIGLSLGAEGGQTSPATRPGPRTTQVGGGVSLAFGRR